MDFIIADDSSFFRNLFKKRLSLLEHNVIAEAASAIDIMDAIQRKQPDFVLIDVSMKPVSGLDIAIDINRRYPSTKIICSTQFNICSWVADMKQIGICGYIYKNSSIISLQKAIEHAQNDQFYIDTVEVQSLVENIKNIIEQKDNTQLEELNQFITEIRIPATATSVMVPINDYIPTTRELVILKATSQGKPIKQIADIVNTTERNVSKIKEKMRKKTGVLTNAELLSLSHKLYWI